ncbi:unnamed protein product [Brassica napus]|uniref:(rape) hypothetical protein n=1 Tax=Brassica napus TaxID=3708 RepID=A0A816IB36_BRANA|nr:unnamed protein product [Brassica napus]
MLSMSGMNCYLGSDRLLFKALSFPVSWLFNQRYTTWWKQRNNVYHNNIIIGPAVIARMIYREVRNTIMPNERWEEIS